MKQLPDKPSELIRLALHDLEVVEKDPRYRVRMAYWHSPNTDIDGKVCDVCFAGAVMANQRGLNDVDIRYDPWDFDRPDQDKYMALDYFRQGLVQQGLNQLGFSAVGIPGYMNVPSYNLHPVRFKVCVREIALRLEAKGL